MYQIPGYIASTQKLPNHGTFHLPRKTSILKHYYCLIPIENRSIFGHCTMVKYCACILFPCLVTNLYNLSIYKAILCYTMWNMLLASVFCGLHLWKCISLLNITQKYWKKWVIWYNKKYCFTFMSKTFQMKSFRIFLIISVTSFFFLFVIYIVILDIYFCKEYINNPRQFNLQLSLHMYWK